MTELAVREQAPVVTSPAALAIRPGQAMWDEFQAAALDQIGLKDASNADRAVFLHQCQRTGLDPFSKQIYMIGRNERVPSTRDQWRTKWTIQTGIDGWRVIRDRAEKRAGVRGILGRAVWYDHDGNEFKVWVRPDPPAACEITYTVRDSNGETPYTSVLKFGEYVQAKDGKPIAQWATKGAHMLEKCTEADVYRKAFPQDFAGIILDDAMPPADAAPAPVSARVTAADIRGGTRPQVRAEVVDDPQTASPATPAPRAPEPQHTPPAEQVAGEAPDEDRRSPRAASGQIGIMRREWERLGYNLDSDDDRKAIRHRVAQITQLPDVTGATQLTQDQAKKVIDTLKPLGDVLELADLLEDVEVPDGN